MADFFNLVFWTSMLLLIWVVSFLINNRVSVATTGKTYAQRRREATPQQADELKYFLVDLAPFTASAALARLVKAKLKGKLDPIPIILIGSVVLIIVVIVLSVIRTL